ncbi:uncharacterized protein TRUGW13939_00536 [Talaromyces rugulosus]|uniref:Zn(2)-C6 fungal-type domain-containing protein n=1 Tax=Talaromyces rugulosus TaxID=121627 RepID=A0A7H8QHL2_TALRU|nr:uncharacterized protein TRUGW13939_00536 [Talaromyces rugulosus]QKX53457.1 hypothetical protein TRUGW13939_00536 [Talaromyces rugulosus]
MRVKDLPNNDIYIHRCFALQIQLTEPQKTWQAQLAEKKSECLASQLLAIPAGHENKRPTCGQCLEYHRQCAWPEQLKRGPAKGYIEALEGRLYETENVLLKLLSRLSQAQLSSMLSENELETGERNQNQPDTHDSGSLSRQREVEYWKVNPLNSVDNIRRWEQECLDIRNKPDADNNNDAENNTTSTRRPRRTKSTTITSHDGAVGLATNTKSPIGQDYLRDRFQEQQQTGPSRRHSEVGGDSQNNTETPPQLITTASPFDASIAENFGPVHHTKEYTSTARTPQLSAWEEAPSISFQKQFLW